MSATSTERTVNTVCAHNCGGRARLSCTVRDGVLVRVGPASVPDEGYSGLCVRCLTLPQWVYSKERILTPMRRLGPRGSDNFAPISWEEAFGEIVERFNRLINDRGSSSIAFVRSTGGSPIGSYSRLAALLGGGGSLNFYGGVDMAVHMGLNSTFGDKGMFGQHANEWTDRVNSKLTIVWGHNPAETSMTAMRHLLDARDAGCRVVVIDPRYSATAMHANWWIAPRPGTDLALALGIVHIIIKAGLFDRAFLLSHSCGPFLVRTDTGNYLRGRDLNQAEDPETLQVWDETKQRATRVEEAIRPALTGRYVIGNIPVATAFSLLVELVEGYSPARVAAITGVPSGDIEDLAHAYCTAGPAQIGLGYGIDRYKHGELVARAAAIMAILTGNIGKPGAGVGVQSHHQGFHTARLGPGPPLPKWAHTVSIPIIEVGRRDLPVRAVFCQGDWINQRTGDMNTTIEYVKKLDFHVCVDHFFQTTTAWSDIILPASTFLEEVGPVRDAVVFGNSIYLRSKVIDPVGESRPDFEIERDLAARFGLSEWYGDDAEAVVRMQIDGSSDPAFDNICYDEIVKAGGALRLNLQNDPNIQYKNLDFSTPSGRAEFYLENLTELGEELPVFEQDHEALCSNNLAARFPLVLIQSHARQRAHSTFFNTTWTLEIWPEPCIEMNPHDAMSRGLEDGDIGEAFNDRGHVVARVILNPDFPPGMCNMSEGWKQAQYREGNVQELTNSDINGAQTLLWGHANIPFFDTRVEVRKFLPDETGEATCPA